MEKAKVLVLLRSVCDKKLDNLESGGYDGLNVRKPTYVILCGLNSGAPYICLDIDMALLL